MFRALERLSAVAAACLQAMALAGAASAEAPTISVDDLATNHVRFVTPPVMDFSRTQLMFEDGITFALEIEHDAKGRIRGRGHDTDGAGFDVTHIFKGKCKTSNGLPTLRQKMASSGSLGSGFSDELRSVGLIQGQVHGWGSQAQLVGSLRSQICITQRDLHDKPFRHCTRNTAPYTVDLAHGGDWQVDAALERSGARVFGAASITTAVELPSIRRTFEVSVNGRVSSDGSAVIDLKPMGPDGLGWVRLEATLSNDDPPTLLGIQGVRGKILGQRFNEVY